MIKWCMLTLCLLLTACSDPPKTQTLKRESVVDQVGVLSSGEKGQLKEKISLIKKDANVDIVIYITIIMIIRILKLVPMKFLISWVLVKNLEEF